MTPTASRWMSRLSFSFLIIGAWLAWQAYRLATISHDYGLPLPMGRVILYAIAAALALMMGMMGIRERHRPQL